MEIRSYAKKHGLTLSSFATRIGVSPGTFHDYVSGRRNMPLRMAVAIEDMTEGQVRPSDWIPSHARSGVAA